MRAIEPNYPTPVQEHAGLWVKRDDLTHTLYGGNKVRKLERILRDVEQRGARRLVTLGAAGSHHVLASAVFGRRAGLEVAAVMAPQPRTDHVAANLRAVVAQGAVVLPVPSFAAAPWAVAGWLLRQAEPARSVLVTVGGSNLLGAMAYADAVQELAEQVRRGEAPEPEAIVVTLGSGGTAAGIAAGLERTTLRARVVAVCVTHPPWVAEGLVRRLARQCARALGVSPGAASARLTVERAFLGAGYGHATPEGERASAIARETGLALDPTYTAKAFAAALTRPERPLLYWHTLSSAPMEPLLAGAPAEGDLDPGLLRLLT